MAGPPLNLPGLELVAGESIIGWMPPFRRDQQASRECSWEIRPNPPYYPQECSCPPFQGWDLMASARRGFQSSPSWCAINASSCLSQ